MNIPYMEIPIPPRGPVLSRHGIYRNEHIFTLDIWVQGRLYAWVSAECYIANPYEVMSHLLKPMWEGTPWQRVLVRQLLYPWTGRIIW